MRFVTFKKWKASPGEKDSEVYIDPKHVAFFRTANGAIEIGTVGGEALMVAATLQAVIDALDPKPAS